MTALTEPAARVEGAGRRGCGRCGAFEVSGYDGSAMLGVFPTVQFQGHATHVPAPHHTEDP